MEDKHLRSFKIPKDKVYRRIYFAKPGSESQKLDQILAYKLDLLLDSNFENSSYGFRRGRSSLQALLEFKSYNEETQHKNFLKSDIENCFGNIHHGIVREILYKTINDDALNEEVVSRFKVGYYQNNKLQGLKRSTGLYPGQNFSPVLVNLVLDTAIDKWVKKSLSAKIKGGYQYWRFADDLLFSFQYQSDLRLAKRLLTRRLKKFRLGFNDKKTRVIEHGLTQSTSFDWLGFNIELANQTVNFSIPKDKILNTMSHMAELIKKLDLLNEDEQLKLALKIFQKIQGFVSYFKHLCDETNLRQIQDKLYLCFHEYSKDCKCLKTHSRNINLVCKEMGKVYLYSMELILERHSATCLTVQHG
jgi:hypothetical protein